MAIPTEYSFTRYLAAKKSVDDRALNRQVWQKLARSLPKSSPDKSLRVLEVGAGIGTMIERILEWNLLDCAVYTALDAQNQNKTHARQRLQQWSAEHHIQFEEISSDYWQMEEKGRCIEICFRDEDLFDFVAHERRRWDLVIANAFLDLMDIPSTLPLLLNLLDKGGLFYFTINFDGLTILEPVIDSEFDLLVHNLYHRNMDERIVNGKRSGNSQAGRRLFSHLKDIGGQILAAGASDWVIFAGPNGYPPDEAYFLHFIVHTIHQALINSPELDCSQFEDWIARRHHQIESRELIYIAHQLDFVGIVVD